MVWTDPGSLSTASVARTHGGGNTARPSRPLAHAATPATGTCRRKVRARTHSDLIRTEATVYARAPGGYRSAYVRAANGWLTTLCDLGPS